MGIRPAGPVARHVDGDQSRTRRAQSRGSEAEPIRRAGREVLQEDVGRVDEPLDDPAPFCRRQVDRNRLLRPVQPDEVGAAALDGVVVFAGEVAAVDPLDLDDASAQIGEMAGGQRRGHRLLHRDHRDSLESPHADMLGGSG